MRNLGVTAIFTVVLATAVPLRAGADARSDRIAAAQRALSDWYECIECQDRELDKLLRYRDLVEGALISTLQNGPSPARQAQIESELRANHQSSPSQTISADQYVELFSANINAGYRTRAAIALGKLGSNRALRALETAAADERLRDDVRAAAQRALRP